MNQITHYLDGSTVYGSDEEDEKELRKYSGGLLKYYDPAHGKGLLPQETEQGEQECQIPKRKQERENKKCFKAGKTQNN